MQAYMAEQASRNPRLRKAQDKFKELPPSIQNSNRVNLPSNSNSFQNNQNVRYSDRVLEQNAPINRDQLVGHELVNHKIDNGLQV